MDTFYAIDLLHPIAVLPPILGSIEAWRALDRGRPITFVRSRPDIIAHHLGGSTYFSNVDDLDADLRSMETASTEPGELRLLELRSVEQGRIPLGIFEPVDGWPLRDLIGFLRCDVPLAATIVLHIFRSYGSGPNVITPSGELVRRVLPHFSAVYEGEVGSFIGIEPDISVRGRIDEGRRILAAVGGLVTRGDLDDASDDAAEWGDRDDTAGAAFEAELERLADGLDAGPALVRVLRDRYSFVSPWLPTVRG